MNAKFGWIGFGLLAVLPWGASCSGRDAADVADSAAGAGGDVSATGGGSSSGGVASTPTGGADGSGGRGSGGAGTGGETAAPGVPSEGCGQGGRPTNGEASGTNYIANFPPTYDGASAVPLLVGLHAAGNPITQIQSFTNDTTLAEKYVRLFPKSEGSAWDYGKDKSRLDAVLDDFFANHCVDLSRVYLTGHSSGAGMAVQLLCDGDDRFAAVAPVAAWKSCNSVSPIPTLYIQGIADAQRSGSNGKDVVDVFASSNSCGASAPYAGVPGCTSGFNGKTVDPGCVSYSDCEKPLIWCSHDDEGYNTGDGHYHGWPCFASEAMAGFFAGLP